MSAYRAVQSFFLRLLWPRSSCRMLQVKAALRNRPHRARNLRTGSHVASTKIQARGSTLSWSAELRGLILKPQSKVKHLQHAVCGVLSKMAARKNKQHPPDCFVPWPPSFLPPRPPPLPPPSPLSPPPSPSPLWVQGANCRVQGLGMLQDHPGNVEFIVSLCFQHAEAKGAKPFTSWLSQTTSGKGLTESQKTCFEHSNMKAASGSSSR